MDRELRRLRQEAAIAGRYDAGVVTRRARAGAAARRQEAVIARKLDEHHANLEVRRVNVETNAKMKLEAQRLRMEKEHVRLRRQELDAEFEHEERLADARAHPGRALERKHQARLEQERRAAREASARRAEGEAKVAEERRRTAALRTSEAKAKERATLAEARRLEAERALAEDKRVADAERQARDRARFDKLKAKFKTLEGRATALLGPIKEREAELQKRTAWVKNAVHKGPHTVARDSRHWQPDREVNACCRCDVGFGLLFFRHHCRFCGHLMCSECAPERPWMRDAARVCEDCLLEIGRQWEAAGLRHSEVNAIFSDRQLPSQELAAKASEARKTIDRYMEAARDEIRHLEHHALDKLEKYLRKIESDSSSWAGCERGGRYAETPRHAASRPAFDFGDKHKNKNRHHPSREKHAAAHGGGRVHVEAEAPQQRPQAAPKPAQKQAPKVAPKVAPKPAPKVAPKPAPKVAPKPAPKPTPRLPTETSEWGSAAFEEEEEAGENNCMDPASMSASECAVMLVLSGRPLPLDPSQAHEFIALADSFIEPGVPDEVLLEAHDLLVAMEDDDDILSSYWGAPVPKPKVLALLDGQPPGTYLWRRGHSDTVHLSFVAATGAVRNCQLSRVDGGGARWRMSPPSDALAAFTLPFVDQHPTLLDLLCYVRRLSALVDDAPVLAKRGLVAEDHGDSPADLPFFC